ncbi:unnamed protein product [Malus baccata var. baccata]
MPFWILGFSLKLRCRWMSEWMGEGVGGVDVVGQAHNGPLQRKDGLVAKSRLISSDEKGLTEFGDELCGEGRVQRSGR